jgi:hypothetical protein
MKNDYMWYKSKKICTQCKKKKAHKNRVRCLDCLEKDSLYRYIKRNGGELNVKYKKDMDIKRKKKTKKYD